MNIPSWKVIWMNKYIKKFLEFFRKTVDACYPMFLIRRSIYQIVQEHPGLDSNEVFHFASNNYNKNKMDRNWKLLIDTLVAQNKIVLKRYFDYDHKVRYRFHTKALPKTIDYLT